MIIQLSHAEVTSLIATLNYYILTQRMQLGGNRTRMPLQLAERLQEIQWLRDKLVSMTRNQTPAIINKDFLS